MTPRSVSPGHAASPGSADAPEQAGSSGAVPAPGAQNANRSGIHRSVSPSTRVLSVEKPVLASEALREELAPAEPASRAARLWLLVSALLFVVLGFVFIWDFGSNSELARPTWGYLSLAYALFCSAFAARFIGYQTRAGLMVLGGLGLMLLGLAGAGPLANLSVDAGGARHLSRLAVLTFLPAALLFRAHYRAYYRARWLLAAALALSLPFVFYELSLLWNTQSSGLARAGAGLNLAVLSCCLFGFTGSATGGGGRWWAGLVLVLIPLETSLSRLDAALLGPLESVQWARIGLDLAASLILQIVSLLAALGLFQLIASRFASHARTVCLPERKSSGQAATPRPAPPPAP